MRLLGNWRRRLLAIVTLVGLVAATVYFAFPELILWAMIASARRSAGLGWRSGSKRRR